MLIVVSQRISDHSRFAITSISFLIRGTVHENSSMTIITYAGTAGNQNTEMKRGMLHDAKECEATTTYTKLAESRTNTSSY